MDQSPRSINQVNINLGIGKKPLSGNGPNYSPMGSRVKFECPQFKKGHCSYGENCRFVHVAEYRNNVAMSMSNGQIRHFPQAERDPGFGRTEFRKTKLCYKWERMGSCRNGANCYYAHGEEAIQRFQSQFVVQCDAVSNTRIRSATAVPDRSCCGPADEEKAREQDKKWKINKKVNGIYADWIDEDDEMEI